MPARVFEAAGGYAPTVGILGAVLGLIHVMENLADPSNLGSGIAVAFVATVYGVGSANLIFLPIGSRFRARAQRNARRREAVLEGVMAIQEGLNPRLIDRSCAGCSASTGRRRAPASPAGRPRQDRRWPAAAGDAAAARQPRALARLLRRLHHAAVRVLHDDVRDLDGRRAEDEQDGGVDAGGAEGRPGPGRAPVPLPQSGVPQPVVPRLDNLVELRQQLSARLQRQIRQGNVEIGVDSRGLVVSIREAGSFASGSAELSDGARALLAEIAAPLSELPHPIRIEGHTDDTPIRTSRFRSNWELSTARATQVIAYLQNDLGLPAARLSAAGYGEFHPRVAERVADGAGREPPRRPRDPQHRDEHRGRTAPPRRRAERARAVRPDSISACASGSCRSIRPSAT